MDPIFRRCARAVLSGCDDDDARARCVAVSVCDDNFGSSYRLIQVTDVCVWPARAVGPASGPA